MKKFATHLGAGLLVVSLLGTAFAAPKMSSSKMLSKMSSHKTTKMAPTQVTGTVTSMTATTLTIKPVMKKMGNSKTITIPSSARIMMGSKSMKLSQLKAGEKVTVMMNGMGTVTRINCMAGGKMMHTKKM